MQRLKIAIDPVLKAKYGLELAWTWRLLLSGMGYAWEEVPLDDSPCDIAYVVTPRQAGPCRLIVRADPERWAQRAGFSLGTVGRFNDWSYPLYEGEQYETPPLYGLNESLVYQRDIIFDVFWLATGQEEILRPKNRHGYVDFTGTPTIRERSLHQALASSIGVSLEQRLCDLGYEAGLPRWPYGKRAAAGVGHDVDYPEVIRWLEPLRIVRRLGARGLPLTASVIVGSRHHWHFASWMEMEKRLGTRSAFYFVARKGSLVEYAGGTPDPFYDVCSERFRKLFRALADEGFEIGLHASYLAYTSQARFAAEKQKLEEASGQPVIGNRHHYWHMDPINPEATLLLHEQIGLHYDTSLVHDHYLGWRRGLSWPFFPFHQGERRELRTLQLPTAWMDDQLFSQRIHNSGDQQTLLRGLAERAAEQGGCMLIDVHEYVYDDALFPGWAQAYRELWEYLVERGDFWLETPRRIAEYWAARYATITRASVGLGL